jgi:hypothetical protein
MLSTIRSRDCSILTPEDRGRPADLIGAGIAIQPIDVAAEDTYQRLVVERGWSPDDYEAWLRRCLQRELIVRSRSSTGSVSIRDSVDIVAYV